MSDTIVIKIGGVAAKQLDQAFISQVKTWQKEKQVVIVHGGGYVISQLMHEANLPVEKVDGLRVTDLAAMPLVEEALINHVGRSLYQQLESAGLSANQVVEGLDQIVRADYLDKNRYGYVGRVDDIDAQVLKDSIKIGSIPLIPSLAYGRDGALLNINADHLATALAISLAAEELILMTDVAGVKEGNQILGQLPISHIEAKISQGVVTGGMIPKIKSAKVSIESGVKMVLIGDNLTSGTKIVEG